MKMTRSNVGGIGQQTLSQRKILNQLVNPSTQSFLLHSGLKPGMKVLDLNCGLGIMSCWIAEQVGPTGKVLATERGGDFLSIAREVASEKNLKNIEFRKMTIDEIDEIKETFDFIYCRFLLIHVKNPDDVLKSVYRHLDKGGIFACESAILGHEFCFPYNIAFDRWRELNHNVFKAMDKDPQTGKKLYSMMHNAGFRELSSKIYQPVLNSQQERQEMLVNDLKEQEAAMLAAELVDEGELESIFDGLKEVVENDSYFIAYCQSCQVAGVKAEGKRESHRN